MDALRRGQRECRGGTPQTKPQKPECREGGRAEPRGARKVSKKCRKSVEKVSKKCRKSVEKVSKKCQKGVCRVCGVSGGVSGRQPECPQGCRLAGRPFPKQLQGQARRKQERYCHLVLILLPGLNGLRFCLNTYLFNHNTLCGVVASNQKGFLWLPFSFWSCQAPVHNVAFSLVEECMHFGVRF